MDGKKIINISKVDIRLLGFLIKECKVNQITRINV